MPPSGRFTPKPVEPPKSLWERFGGLPGIAAAGARGISGVLSPGLLPGAIISGTGEAIAQGIEGLSGIGPKQSFLQRLERIALEAGLGAIPFSKVVRSGQTGLNLVRAGANAAGGDIGRQMVENQSVNPLDIDYQRAGIAGAFGGGIGAGAQKGIDKFFPKSGQATKGAASKAEEFVVEQTARPGGRVLSSTKGELTDVAPNWAVRDASTTGGTRHPEPRPQAGAIATAKAPKVSSRATSFLEQLESEKRGIKPPKRSIADDFEKQFAQEQGPGGGSRRVPYGAGAEGVPTPREQKVLDRENRLQRQAEGDARRQRLEDERLAESEAAARRIEEARAEGLEPTTTISEKASRIGDDGARETVTTTYRKPEADAEGGGGGGRGPRDPDRPRPGMVRVSGPSLPGVSDDIESAVSELTPEGKERNFLLRWLADDLDNLRFEQGGTTPTQRAEAFENWRPGDPESAKQAIGPGSGRAPGTPVYQMLEALGIGGTYADKSSRLRTMLESNSVDPRLDNIVEVLRRSFRNGKFDLDNLDDEAASLLGDFPRSSVRGPVTPPNISPDDPEFGELFAKYFGPGAQDEVSDAATDVSDDGGAALRELRRFFLKEGAAETDERVFRRRMGAASTRGAGQVDLVPSGPQALATPVSTPPNWTWGAGSPRGAEEVVDAEVLSSTPLQKLLTGKQATAKAAPKPKAVSSFDPNWPSAEDVVAQSGPPVRTQAELEEFADEAGSRYRQARASGDAEEARHWGSELQRRAGEAGYPVGPGEKAQAELYKAAGKSWYRGAPRIEPPRTAAGSKTGGATRVRTEGPGPTTPEGEAVTPAAPVPAEPEPIMPTSGDWVQDELNFIERLRAMAGGPNAEAPPAPTPRTAAPPTGGGARGQLEQEITLLQQNLANAEPNSAAERSIMESLASMQRRLNAMPQEAPAAPAFDSAPRLKRPMKDIAGLISDQMPVTLASTIIGGLTGAALNPNDPFTSGAMGAAAGFAAPQIPLFARNMYRPGLGEAFKDAFQSGAENVKDTLTRTIEMVPNMQRANLLSSSIGLPINAVVGPYGSAVTGALEEGIKGNNAGWLALKRLMNPKAFGQSYLENLGEAAELVRKGDMGRAEHFSQNPFGGDVVEAATSIPAVAMASGDITGKKILTESGIAEKAARNMMLTDEPEGRIGHAIATFGRGNPEDRQGRIGQAALGMMLPFRRTPANVVDTGLERLPGIGLGIHAIKEGGMDWNTALAQQAISVPISAGAAVAGYNSDKEQASWLRRLISNASGRYSLPASLSFLAGNVAGQGGSMKQFAQRASTEAMPLPSAEPIEDAINLVTGSGKIPRGAYPAVLRELFGAGERPPARAGISAIPSFSQLRRRREQ